MRLSKATSSGHLMDAMHCSDMSANIVQSLQDFWCMFHFSYPPSKLENVDYSLFKQGWVGAIIIYYNLLEFITFYCSLL